MVTLSIFLIAVAVVPKRSSFASWKAALEVSNFYAHATIEAYGTRSVIAGCFNSGCSVYMYTT